MLLQIERFVFRLREMLSSALFRLRVTDGCGDVNETFKQWNSALGL